MTLLRTERGADSEQPRPAKPRYTSDTGLGVSPVRHLLSVARKETIPCDEAQGPGQTGYAGEFYK